MTDLLALARECGGIYTGPKCHHVAMDEPALAAYTARVRALERVAIKARQTGWERGGKRHVLDVYVKLHDGKIGMHWMWAAVERLATKAESETSIMEDFGYTYTYEPPAAILALAQPAKQEKT